MFYHLTRRNLGREVTLDPKYAKHDIYESEQAVAFAPSIEQAYEALPMQIGPGNLGFGYRYKNYYVYVPVSGEGNKLVEANVDDVEWTEEKRSCVPINVKCLGKIRIVDDFGNYVWLLEN